MKKLITVSIVAAGLLTSIPLMAQTFTQSSPLVASCMQAVIQQRDEGYINAFNSDNVSVTSALKVREDAQVTAWTLPDSQRRIAMDVAERAFTASYNNASLQLLRAKSSVRVQFNASVKACQDSQPVSSAASSTGNGVCQKWECGPMMGMPNWLCSDGSIGGPVCQRSENGKCGYVIRQCMKSSSSSVSSVMCQNLSGTVQGTYAVPRVVPDIGTTYNITAAGNMTTLGSVQVTGSLHTPGFVMNGQATGQITLSNAQGSITLALTGPMQPGFSPLPGSFSYSVQSATGIYAGTTGQGTVTVRLDMQGSGTILLTIDGSCR